MAKNIVAVQKPIMQDRHVTYYEIGSALGISSTSKHKILLRSFSLSISANAKKNNGDDLKDICEIVTGDQSWIYAYTPEIKEQSTR